jgi:TolA-binding protein
MFKTKAELYLILLIALSGFNVQADISPVVIETVFKIGSWQPLPEDKIRSAAVDSALGEISKTKQFAFFTARPTGLKTGTLKISIHLVEEAEMATVSILLQQVNGISVSSTHSESLKAQYYDAIYKRFQLAGSTAGKKIAKILESQTVAATNRTVPLKDQDRVNYLENQIIDINNKIIQQTGNNSIRSEAKLEYILSELKSINSSYGDLAQKEDIQKQGVKIDKVLYEVGQLNNKIDNKPGTQINVNQNYVIENVLTGQSKLPGADDSGRDDDEARQLYNEAQEFKQNKQYRKAEDNLQQALRLTISSGLSSLILDELNYALPMFEAQSIAIDLGGNFQAYAKTGRHTVALDRITTIYKTALKNNQQDFQRTRAIQAALDQHLNTSQAMMAVISAQNKNNGYMVHRYMQMEYMMEGKYPDKEDFSDLLKRVNLRYKVLSYQATANKYSAKLQADAGDVFNLSVDENGELTVD